MVGFIRMPNNHCQHGTLWRITLLLHEASANHKVYLVFVPFLFFRIYSENFPAKGCNVKYSLSPETA